MSQFEETFSLPVDDDSSRCLNALRSFYEHNGYRPSATNPSASTTIVLTRGKPSAGWWSSNMTDLYTTVSATADDEGIELTYRVDTTGQHLTDEDEAFWRREATSAKNYMRGHKPLIDLRPIEADRAKKIKREHRGVALQGAFIVIFIVVTTVLISDFYGCF